MLRLEAGNPLGYLTVTDHEARPPYIAVDGDLGEARWVLGDVVDSLRCYLDKCFMTDLPRMELQVRWTLDMRCDTYQVLLSQLVSDHSYRLLVFGKHDNGLIRSDLELAHARLSELDKTFWP